MRSLVLLLAAVSVTGCFKPTWVSIRRGEALRPDTVVLVGAFSSLPAIQQHDLPRNCQGTWSNGHYEPPGKIVFVQETEGNVMAFFTPDLSQPWSSDGRKVPSKYDWTYMPLDGVFFVQVPRVQTAYLRGFTYLTNAGTRMFDLPAKVEIGPEDRVVYIGEIRVQRGPKGRAEFVNRLDVARRTAKERGLDGIADLPWTTRLLESNGTPSLGEEWGDACGPGDSWRRLDIVAK
jgi:hypothetical protein